MSFQFIEELGYFGLFCASFLAATFLPFSSEAIFTAMGLNHFNPVVLVIVAGVGNTFGGMFNYLIGFFGKLDWAEKYLNISHYQILKWKKYFSKYGAGLAFFCWLPIIGDPLALALGYFKTSWKKVLIYMLIGKVIRYCILAMIVLKLFN